MAFAEVAQVLWKKEQAGYIKSSELDEIIIALLKLPREIIGHYDILSDAVFLARHHGLTVYDSLFPALAKRKKSELVTADQRLRSAFENSL